MNLDNQSTEFIELLMDRLTDESVPMYPDPFLLQAKDYLTGHRQVFIGPEQIAEIEHIFDAFGRIGSNYPAKSFALNAALNDAFTNILQLPDESDVFHMYIPGQPTPVQFYR